MRRVAVPTAVSATVDMLRDEILQRDDGEWLGWEDDLVERLGVSRPTLRQAARLLEAEELLVVKRGTNGGLFARRPTTDAVARMASVFLRAEGTTVLDLARSWFLLLEQSARLAAEHDDPLVRASLVAEVAEIRRSVPEGDRDAMFVATYAFSLELADLSRSPTLRLFTRVLSTLIAEAPADLRPIEALDEQLGGPARHTFERVAEAIRDGDAARAAKNVRVHADLMIQWLITHMPDRTL
jgi:GntR family transcriptional repressor for pyruvate dehydrogenase complex